MLRGIRKALVSFLTVVVLASFVLAGCTRYANDEQLKTLDETKAAALSAEKTLEQKEQEKASLEKKLSEKQDELQKVKEEKSKVQSKL